VPVSGRIRPAMSESVSDFPAPEGPKSTDIPDSTVKATSRSNSPIRRVTATSSAGVRIGSG
jgi:hypothetical protein